MKLNELKKRVERILTTDPDTRSSDGLLYYRVCQEITDMSKVTTYDMLVNRNRLGLPVFESVRRTRQKVQAQNSDLRASKTVEDFRTEQELNYREYARGY